MPPWSGPTSPTGDRPWPPKKKSNKGGKKTSPPTGTTTRTVAPPVSLAPPPRMSPHDQKMALLAPYFDAQQKRIDSAYGGRADSIRTAYEALAAAGRGVGPAIQDVYQNASRDTAAFGKGFSDAVSQLSGGYADEATAALAAQGGPQTVTSGLEGGGGDALYAMGGAIPASALAREGAGFASAASFLPSTAAGLGVSALKEIEQERLREILGLEADRTKEVFDLVSKMGGGSSGGDLKMVKLADGRIQFFDPSTGQPAGQPMGPRKASSGRTSNLQSRTLSDGRVQWFNPATGKPVGPPQGPVRTSGGNLQARTLANGQIQWFDPSTGQAVGRPVGPPRAASAAAKNKGYNLQAKPLGDGRYQWYDPRTGKPHGKPFGQPKAGGRNGGYTKGQIQKLTALAYDSVLEAKNGVVDKNGNVVLPPWNEEGGKRPKDVLQDLIGHGIPFDIAVKAIARAYPPAKKWYNKKSGSSSSTPLASRNGGFTAPASFRSTHETDGLGWPAVDIMGKPGTPVGAPVSGRVVRHGSAQGGEALYLQGDNGHMYWMGHIDGMIPVGTRVRRGETVAYISADHDAPHLHLARQ